MKNGVLAFVLAQQANQLVDSKLATTREFWRRKLGFPDEIATDPRPLYEAIAARTGADK